MPTAAHSRGSATSCAGSRRAQRVSVAGAVRADGGVLGRRDRHAGLVAAPRLADRVRPDGPRPRPVRVVDARGRAPAAVQEASGQRLGRAVAARLSRRSRRPRATAACTWPTTARSSVRTSPTSRSTPATRSPRRRCAASCRATRRAAPASSCSASSSAALRTRTPQVAARAVRDLGVQARAARAPRSPAGDWWLYPLFWLAART